ncbi:hypothetical protein [Pseudomonas putida]
MAYNSAHTGPEIDAAVQLLSQIQDSRDSTSHDLVEVRGLAAEVKGDAGQVASHAGVVNTKAAQVLASSAAVEQARVVVEGATASAVDSKDLATLAAASAQDSQSAASASEQAAAQSQLEAGLSEQVSAGHAAESTAAAEQVAQDRLAAQASALSAAISAQNAEAVVTGGAASVMPSPGMIPLADALGRIDDGWIPQDIARAAAVQAAAEAAAEAVDLAAEAQARTASFLQPSPEAPVLRDDGAPLQIGDRYTNTIDQSEYIYRDSGWVANESQVAIDALLNNSDISKGATGVGYEGGNVRDVLNGMHPFGPSDQRVDQFTGSNANPSLGGPLIKRPWCTTAPLQIFVDPAVGSDLSDGTTKVSPLRTIAAALQLIPQNIYHKTRIYLLDGDYGDQNIKVFNHYVTSRGTAGFRIIGHVASFDGDVHPIYTDTNPDAVILRGYEHMVSGIRGTEEFAIMGVRFQDGWLECYDSAVNTVYCNFDGGHRTPAYSSYHAFGGHNYNLKAFGCNFSNLASIGSFTDWVFVTFEQCSLGGLHTTSGSSVKGIPFSVGDQSRVLVKNSPTLLAAGPNGKPQANAGVAYDISEYSSAGYSTIRRSAPTRDERVSIVSHDGGSTALNRGAGLDLNAMNYPIDPGFATLAFGPSSAAKAVIKYAGTSATGGQKNAGEFNAYGDLQVYAKVAIGLGGQTLTAFMKDDTACTYLSSDGIRVAMKKGGVIKVVKILDWATAEVYSVL